MNSRIAGDVMNALARFGVSCEQRLLSAFDRDIYLQGYPNRSEAIADLMRAHLLRGRVEKSDDVIGVVTLSYEYHRRELADRLLRLQHQHHERMVSSLHVPVDSINCLEVHVIRGTAEQVQELGWALISTRGVLNGQMVVTVAHPHETTWMGEVDAEGAVGEGQAEPEPDGD